MAGRHDRRSRAWLSKKVADGAWADLPDSALWATAFKRLATVRANTAFGEAYKNDLAYRELYAILSELHGRGVQGRFHF